MQNSLIGVCFGVGVEDQQKDRAQLGIEAINRKGADGLLQRTDTHMHATNWIP